MGQKMILVGKFVGRNCFWSEIFLISEFFCLLENYLVGNFFGWTIFLFDNFVGQGGRGSLNFFSAKILFFCELKPH